MELPALETIYVMKKLYWLNLSADNALIYKKMSHKNGYELSINQVQYGVRELNKFSNKE